MLSADHVSYAVAGKTLLQEISLSFEAGKFHVIMGSNGAGKSTLLKLLAGALKPTSGAVKWNNTSLQDYSKKELARKRAVLSQHYHISFPVSVKDIVMMGRYPFFSAHPSGMDISICRSAMVLMNVAELAERDYNTLSGGEAQKVQMSRVFAQIWGQEETGDRILFLDEPVSHLDIKYQYQLLKAARELCAKGVTVIAILHDLNLAISFAERLIFMKKGVMVSDTRALTGITTSLIKEVFDVSSTIVYPEQHKPVVIF